jgi:hypothetical protein
MVLNLGAWHFSSDNPGIQLEVLAPLSYPKILKVNEPEFISSSQEVQFNISVEPTGGTTIFAGGTSNVVRKAKSFLNLHA